jgi:hypothetical protein
MYLETVETVEGCSVFEGRDGPQSPRCAYATTVETGRGVAELKAELEESRRDVGDGAERIGLCRDGHGGDRSSMLMCM